MPGGKIAAPKPRMVRAISLLLAACASAAAAMTAATLIAWLHFASAADLYRKLATDSQPDVERTLAAVRGTLAFGGLVTVVTVLLWAWLAVMVRVPQRRWPQLTTWVLSVLGIGLLSVDLSSGLVNTGSSTGIGIGTTPRDLLGYDLAPDWYPAVNSILGVITLALMVIGALALSSSSVVDYYRKASWQQDDRWTAFVADQKNRIADGS